MMVAGPSMRFLRIRNGVTACWEVDAGGGYTGSWVWSLGSSPHRSELRMPGRGKESRFNRYETADESVDGPDLRKPVSGRGVWKQRSVPGRIGISQIPELGETFYVHKAMLDIDCDLQQEQRYAI